MIDLMLSNLSDWGTQVALAESKYLQNPLPQASRLDYLHSPSSLAFAETRLALTKLLYNFDIEGVPGSRDWANQQKAYLLWDKQPFLAILKPIR